MIKDTFSIEDLLEIFVSGGIVMLGAWYLNRAALFEYFPAIAQDVNSMGDSKLGGKAVVFVILVMFAGVIITHIFDAVLPLIIENHRIRRTKGLIIKKLFSYALLIVSAPTMRDPRAIAIERYLNSNRKDWFLKMVQAWAHSDERRLVSYDEKIVVHQHIGHLEKEGFEIFFWPATSKQGDIALQTTSTLASLHRKTAIQARQGVVIPR
jgi:hypothetical protein